MTLAALDDPRSTFSAAIWLKAQARPFAHDTRNAIALTVLDVVLAIGFAGGLALAIPVLAQGLVGAAPGLALAFVSLVARGGLALMAAKAGARAGQRMKSSVRRMIVSGLFTAAPGSASGLTPCVEGVETLDGYVSRFVTAKAAASVAPLIAIAACALASPISAAILLATLVPFSVGMALAGMAAGEESRRQFSALDRLASRYLDRVRALPVILAFQAETSTETALAQDSERLAQKTSGVLRVAFLSSAIMEFFVALSVALVAVYCGFALLGLLPFSVPETLDLPRALFVLAMAPEVYAPIRRLAAAYHERQAAEAAAPALAALANGVPPPARSQLVAAPTLRFDAVEVRYPNGEIAVRDFSLTVAPGETVALLGASGAGKTSVLHLLLGLAPLTAGQVRVDGRPVADDGGMGGTVAWAGQHPFVSPGSLGHNIALVRPGSTQREVMAAAAQAGLFGDIERPIDERGGGLSGGERRRLGLARALLSNAPLVLLDEPTANLDAASEAALLPMLRNLMRGRTALIATHSDRVAALADRIVRL
ncbi:thiol reductant ABC exporter subunit CydD [Brevundimonas bacteroides]|uniref:thiol reductant ABC exporter subunit CydD n=1 Tax=Brevundimonas bacteroides TaxID=74311 RepID=UPI0004972D78|nr:thiol reductant ABC exporter subunit CydD [Brevundimonas bacteroides]